MDAIITTLFIVQAFLTGMGVAYGLMLKAELERKAAKKVKRNSREATTRVLQMG